MGRYLGIDYGRKRVGIALSDPLNIFANGITTLDAQSAKKLMTKLVALTAEHDIEGLVLGNPLRTTGEAGPESDAVRVFGDALAEATHLPVFYEDERLTSVIAQQSLHLQGISPSRNKGLVDQTAAALILQQFLDRRARTHGTNAMNGSSQTAEIVDNGM